MSPWNPNARIYDNPPRHFIPYKKLVADVVRAVNDGIPARSRVLDAECGTGNLSIELANRGFEVVGLDCSSSMLDRARSKAAAQGLSNLKFREWDLNRGIGCYIDRSFDCVVSVYVLCALRNPQQTVKEYFRLLRPGGRLILAEPQHRMRALAAFMEIYSEVGLYNVACLATTQLLSRLFHLLTNKLLGSSTYHLWQEEELRKDITSQDFAIESVVATCYTNSPLLVSAVRPRHCFVNDRYHFRTAETDEDLHKVGRFRHNMFCMELGVLPANETGTEIDHYDKQAVHFMCTDENSRIIATMRIVFQGSEGFPMEPDFQLTEYMRAKGIVAGVECSRLVVDRSIPSEIRGTILFGLFVCLVNHCLESGITHIYSATFPAMVRKWSMPGFVQIGEEFTYSKWKGQPTVLPMECDIRQAYEQYLASPLASSRSHTSL